MQAFVLQDCDCILIKKYNPTVRSTLRHEFYKINQLRTYQTSPELNDLLEAKNQLSVVAGSSVFASVVLHAHIIVCISKNGKIATKLAQNRPHCPILAVVHSRKLARILNIYKNILPTVFCENLSGKSYMDQIAVQLKYGIDVAKRLKLISVGDLVVYCYDTFEKTNEDVTTYQTTYLSEDSVQN